MFCYVTIMINSGGRRKFSSLKLLGRSRRARLFVHYEFINFRA